MGINCSTYLKQPILQVFTYAILFGVSIFIVGLIFNTSSRTFFNMLSAFLLALGGILSYFFLRKGFISKNDFLKLFEANSFVLLNKTENEFYAQNNKILFAGTLLNKYIPTFYDFALCSHLGLNNLKFFIVGKCIPSVDLTIHKKGNKISINSISSIFGKNKIENDISKMRKIIEEAIQPIDEVHISRMTTSNEVISIKTGPNSLLHGNFAKTNIPNTIKFIYNLIIKLEEEGIKLNESPCNGKSLEQCIKYLTNLDLRRD